jgi:hypothetical protein
MDLSNGYVYDIEVYPNAFTLSIFSIKTKTARVFEISSRKNEVVLISTLIGKLQKLGGVMIGFNNIGYDYPVVHYLMTHLANFTDGDHICKRLYLKSQEIINTPFDNRFAHTIWDKDQLVPQVDLYKVHHFDNPAKATSLKVLEFNMRMEDIRETPVAFGTMLTDEQIDEVISYNAHDIVATFMFYEKSLKELELRTELASEYERNFINHSDSKIGSDLFVMQLEAKLGKKACFISVDGQRKPRQTKRPQIALKDVVFDYVDFRTEEFNAVRTWMESQVIKTTKAVFTELDLDGLGELLLCTNLKLTKGKVKNLNCILDGMQFVFGTGGIHASVEEQRIESDDDYVIIDLDVAGYYPSLAIANRVYPEHLGDDFCDCYQNIVTMRGQFPKGSSKNKAFKLAGNSVYGNSNNKFSPFFDPQYTMTITVNGQFLLCMLYEDLRQIEGLSLIQMNTDGLTVKLPRASVDDLQRMRAAWEMMTGLVLEEATYKMMHIRDVNNYIAVYQDGKVKCKGAYEFEYVKDSLWHKNFSALIVKKAAYEYVVNGKDIRQFITNHEDDYDFYLRTKVPRTSRLVGDWGYEEEPLQNVTRYYISKEGCELIKIMPPLPKKPGVERRMAVNKGCKVTVMNKLSPIDRDTIDYDWYVEQAIKLVNFEGDYEDAADA